MIGRRGHRLRERDLVALADGSLPEAKRAGVERAVAASPQLQASIASQRRALAALRGADDAVPHSLRARLALARDPRRRRRIPERLAGMLAAAALTAIIAALTIGGGGAAAPTVADAATLATRPAVAPALEPRKGSVTLPRLRGAGLSYPYWEDSFGFKALGARRDRLGARLATTVFYARAGKRIAYTIVSGPPLAAGSAMRSIVNAGTHFRSFSAGGRRIVTWLRRGHTCTLSAISAPYLTLLRLAAWTRAARNPS
jgi:hypothetical protein